MAEIRADGKPGVKNQQEEYSKQMRRWFAPKKFDVEIIFVDKSPFHVVLVVVGWCLG